MIHKRAISSILDCFGKASGLVTNMTKTEIFPVRCADVDLQEILNDFPAKLACFPGKYLGLPLHFRRLRKVDLQPLIDKIAGKLPGWIGKNLARPGRVILAKTVLMATSTYHATAIPLPKWARERINKIARTFVWAGEEGEHAAQGKALVNWRTICRPKKLGGLGIPDIERSGRALRLRWPWLQWTDPDRAWSGSKLPCDDTDMSLFRAATKVTIGNGETAKFWHDNWYARGPLSQWAPDLYRIATRKNRTVAKELSENNWICSVASLNSPQQLAQYIDVWEAVHSINLAPELPDTIVWMLNADSTYTASSAYEAQFLGSHARFDAMKIWSAHAEPKCKLFGWLALHGKLLTADMLAIRGWPHDPRCPLCLSEPETADHLCRNCPFTAAVWNLVKSWDGDSSDDRRLDFQSISDWWNDMIKEKPQKEKKRISGRFLYVLWNAWKERNRRIFTGQRLTYLEVASIANEDILQRDRAINGFGPAIPADPD